MQNRTNQSTISSHLNWGSSYITLDFYKRFVNPDATEKRLVNVGRISTVVLMILSCLVALYLSNALSAFNILLQIGAGTGLIFILRWFWWRVNAYSEISGMIISFAVALYFEFVHEHFFAELASHVELVIGVGVTTLIWIAVTLMTRPTTTEKLVSFYNAITPYGRGWNGLRNLAAKENRTLKVGHDNFTLDLGSMLLGIAMVYTALFGMGYLIYGNLLAGSIMLAITALSGFGIYKLWNRKKGTE